MELHNLHRVRGYIRRKKRVGRGQGSGKGSHTTGRGAKGQKIRGKVRLYFEGGQLPVTKRIPHQRGAGVARGKKMPIIKIGDLNFLAEGAVVTPAVLINEGKVGGSRAAAVKIVGGGHLEKKLTLVGFQFSAKARQDLISAGATIR